MITEHVFVDVFLIHRISSKHGTFTQCCFDAGPTRDVDAMLVYSWHIAYDAGPTL